MKKLCVCVLFGGVSPEHEVSLRSAESVLNNIDHSKFPSLAGRRPKTIPMTLSRAEEPRERTESQRIVASERTFPERNDRKDVDKPENRDYIDVHKILDSLSADERAIVEQLTNGPKHIDEIVDGCQLPAGRVLASMTLLEVKGYIRRLPARRFSLAEK